MNEIRNQIRLMEQLEINIPDGDLLLIREARIEDAKNLLDFAETVSSESDFLTFGAGELDFSTEQEEAFIKMSTQAANHLLILGLIDRNIVAMLSFAGGDRPRTRHSGEFSMSVRKSHWGFGIGGLMVDTLIKWARETGIVKKIDLCVRTDNHRAILLYERKNFVIEGHIRKELYLKGKYFDLYHMGLVL